MKNIRLYAIALLMLLGTQTAWGQERTVFWMHGLNGDIYSLQAYSDYFKQSYNIKSGRPGYPSTQGIKYAVEELETTTGASFSNNPKNIVVTHSMGGLVARYYDQKYDNRFGGLITIAAPHQGSEFAASFDNGKLKSFFTSIVNQGFVGYKTMSDAVETYDYHKEVIDELQSIINGTSSLSDSAATNLKGLFEDVFKLNFWLRVRNLFNDKSSVNPIASSLIEKAENLTGALVHLAAQSVFAADPTPKNELKPNSNMLKQINSKPFIGGADDGLQHTINICCVSPNNPGVKFLGSRLNAAINKNAGIGGLDDQQLIRFINAMNTTAYRCQELYAKRFRAGSWWSLGLSNDYYRTRRDAFQNQANFWTVSNIESLYQNCLGKYTQTHTETWGEWVWVGYGDPTVPRPDEPEPLPWIDLQAFEQPFVDAGIQKIQPPAYETDPDNPIYPYPDGHWEWRERSRTYTTTHTHENDGIVTLPSQKGWNDAKKTFVLYGTRADGGGIDHEKAKRSNEVRDLLIEIMDGKHDPWFYTSRK